MKKLFALLLAFVMVFSLVACGSEDKPKSSGTQQESTQTNTKTETTEATEKEAEKLPKEIEITVDNWQDYFEFREIPEWNYNDFDEIEGFDQLWNVLCLKEEYQDLTISDKTNLAFEYSALEKYVAFEADLETQELILGDTVNEQEITQTFAYDTTTLETRVMLANLEKYNPVLLFDWGGNNHEVIKIENISFIRIEGTLFFE